MRCCVPGCKSDSRYSLKSLGITFYMLPNEPSLRNAWFQVLGIEEPWKPNERPAVCSEHFLCEDLFQAKSGLLTLRVDSVPFTVQVCRICLVMDTKMFSIKEYKLEQAYEQLTGVSLLSENRLPHELCAECAQRLINFSRFRHKSLRANSLMLELLNKHKEITELNIQSISRENNQLISNLTTETNIDHYDFCIEEVDDEDIEIIPEEVKPVVTPDLDTTINAEDVEINYDILTSNYDESDVKDDDYSTDNSSLLEETKKKGVKYIQYEKVDENEVAINNIVLNKNNESDVIDDNSFSDNSLLLEETKKSKEYRRNAKVKTNKRAEIKVDGQKKTLLDEILKIFTVTDLTLKEQLADIENRKESLNYKNSPFKCVKCYKGFSNAVTYNTHMVRHTMACGEYPCSICKIHFKSKYACRNHHIRNHSQRLSCKQCSYVTTYRQSAKLHSEWHNGTKFECPYCGEVFYKKSSYMGHVRIKHPSDFVCVLCGYSFVSEKGITVHKYLKHRLNNKPIPEDGPVCETCDYRFLDAEALKRHLSVSTRHENVDGKKRNEHALKRPSQWKFMKKKTKEGPDSCEQCGVQLKTWRDYHAHFRKKHPEKNRTKYTSVKSLSMCEVCGKILYCDALLKDHKRVHEGKRNFKCDMCDKSFLTKQRMLVHKSIHNAGKSTYACKLCGKQFGWYANRQRHMLIHTGLKPWRCEFCGKAFKQPSEKRAHTAHVHLKKPWPKRIRGKRRTDGQQVTLSNQQSASPASDEDTNYMGL